MKKNLKLFIFRLFLFLILIFLDQAVKFLVMFNLKNNDKKVCLIRNFLAINYTKNYGVAFGILNNLNSAMVTFLVGAIILIFAIFIVIFTSGKIKDNKIKLFVLIIFSGGASNYIDRLTKGFVIDYIELSFFPPIFNLADIYVTLGTLFFMLYIIFCSQNKRC